MPFLSKIGGVFQLSQNPNVSYCANDVKALKLVWGVNRPTGRWPDLRMTSVGRCSWLSLPRGSPAAGNQPKSQRFEMATMSLFLVTLWVRSSGQAQWGRLISAPRPPPGAGASGIISSVTRSARLQTWPRRWPGMPAGPAAVLRLRLPPPHAPPCVSGSLLPLSFVQSPTGLRGLPGCARRCCRAFPRHQPGWPCSLLSPPRSVGLVGSQGQGHTGAGLSEGRV